MEDRYSRQVLFGGIGPEGQVRLGKAFVLLVGCGALGSLLAELMVRAGAGRVRIVDRDFVEPSNLQRQVLFDESDAANALPKAVAAERKLRKINSDVIVEGIVEDVSPSTLEGLAAGCDLVLDGADNFEVRYLVNDWCVREGTPWVYGAAVGSYGLTMTVLPGETACLRCVFDEAPPPGGAPTCDTAGVVGPVVGVVASLQAAEGLKILAGTPEKVSRDLVTVDVWENRIERVRVRRREGEACPACGQRTFEHLKGSTASLTTTLCGRNAVQIAPAVRPELDLEALAERLAPLGSVTSNAFLVRADLGEQTLTVFADGRAIVTGTRDPSKARAIYARTVGS